MNDQRKIELLTYAQVCFEKCTNPFETMHLIKKAVKASECFELSELIAECIAIHIEDNASHTVIANEYEKAVKEFAETQQ